MRYFEASSWLVLVTDAGLNIALLTLCVANDETQPSKGKASDYGHSNSLDLAKHSIAAARENADHFAIFATAAYFGGVEN